MPLDLAAWTPWRPSWGPWRAAGQGRGASDLVPPLDSAFAVSIPGGLEPGKVYVGKSIFGYPD